MTNFSPPSPSHRLLILNEFLQLKRDSSWCPAGCMMSISSLSPAAQQSSEHFFYAVCGFVNRFAVFVSHSFHFLSISSSSSFSSYCIYISCNFLRLDSEQFGNTHSHTSINCLAHTCVHNSEIAAQAILKRRVGRDGNTGRTNVCCCCCCWGFGAGLRRRWYL